MAGIDILFLSKEDVDTLALSLAEVMEAIEMGLKAHGEKKVLMPSKDHLALDYPEKLFNILTRALPSATLCWATWPTRRQSKEASAPDYYRRPQDM